jgi:carbonic anhydrase
MPAVLARRTLFGLSAAFACPLCRKAEAVAPPAEFGYAGADGPEHWGELSPDYRACGTGTQQSPINLTDAVKARLETVAIDYKKVPLRVWNNGHTSLTGVPAGSTVKVAGVTYKLLQFHFHHPSEHQIDGKSFPMEAHFVNKAADGSFCAVGAFIVPGRPNPVLESVLKVLPPQKGADTPVPGVTVDPMRLIPANRVYFRYMGSVTTPPCPETVTWVVFRTPVEASAEQIAKFAAVFPMDARPLQATNRRIVLESGG